MSRSPAVLISLRSMLVWLVAVSLLLAAGPTIAAPGGKAAKQAARDPSPTARRHAKDRVIVGFAPGASRVKRNRAVAKVKPRKMERLSRIGKHAAVVKLPPGLTVEAAITALDGQPGIAYVEPDYWLRPLQTSNDPYFTDGSHWGMYGDASAPANKFGSGAAEAWAKGRIGKKSVYVGIIDEGIKHSHPDLSANVWTNPFEIVNGIDDDGNGFVDDIHGWDFYNGDDSVYDGTGDDHGTHVAGTVGARGGNGIGVAGVNWRVTLISAKFLGPAGGWSSDAAAALDYLTDLKIRHGLNIVATSNSWGGGSYSQTLLDAINRSGDAGILFVAAAGNGGRDIDPSPNYPASYRCDTRADGSPRGWDCNISVANLRSDGAISGSSNFGSTDVDLGAPGTGIISTHPGSTGYASYSGTSMATPHVSGGVALCASLDPSLSARRIRGLIMSTARATVSMAGVTVSGGRLDVDALAEACDPAEPEPTPDPTPTPTPTPPAAGDTLTVDDRSGWFIRRGTGWRHTANGYKGHHLWVPARRGSRQRLGSWVATLPESGYYRVLVRIPSQANMTRRAVYRVRTASGWITRRRDQRKNRGRWLSLGVLRLGTRPVVRLADNTGEAWRLRRRVAFDAVRFIPVEAPAASGGQADRASGPRSAANPSSDTQPMRTPKPASGPDPTQGPKASSEPTPAPSQPTPAPTEPPPGAADAGSADPTDDPPEETSP